MIKTLLLAGAVSILTVVGAHAADVLPEPVPEAYDWSGFYIGGVVGYGWADATYEFNENGTFNDDSGDEFDHDLEGLMAGGILGVNWQDGSLVYGLEGSFLWTDLDKRSDSPFFPDEDFFETSVEWVATVTPRVGAAMDNVLFFAKGGLAIGEIKTQIDSNTVTPLDTETKTQLGWTVGLGVDWALTENIIFGVEGNYYDFGSFNIEEDNTDHDVEVDLLSALARLTFKFDAI